MPSPPPPPPKSGKLSVLLLVLALLSLGALCILLYAQSLRNIAPLLDDKNKGIRIGPLPATEQVVPPGDKSCLPTSPTGFFRVCTKEADCRECSERPHGEYLQCLKPEHKQSISVNGVPVPMDANSYCLPPKYNVCTPGFSESVWKAEAGVSDWECQCVYPEGFQLFQQATQDSDCSIPVSCSRDAFRVCSKDHTRACGVDADCGVGEVCSFMPNRLVSIPRLASMPSCVVGDGDPACVQTHVSNFTLDSQGEMASGSGRPGYPLLIRPTIDTSTGTGRGGKTGLQMPDWDPQQDGPLLYDNSVPSWLVDEMNPDCQGPGNETNPGCSVAEVKWGGQCYCDPTQHLVSWKDYHTTMKEPQQQPQVQAQDSSQGEYFSCMHDSCQVRGYVPVVGTPAEVAAGYVDPGPRLITAQNTFMDFLGEKSNIPPTYLGSNRCWCGNAQQAEDGTYTSYISYLPDHQPNFSPMCVKDPCNPGGYWDPDIVVPAGGTGTTTKKGACVCNSSIAVEDDASMFPYSQCLNICNTQICGPNGTCIVKDKKITCKCDSCHEGPNCQIEVPRHGDSCVVGGKCCNSRCNGFLCV